MKIAAVTDNGTMISAHFGRAEQFVVITIEDGQIVSQETRNKTACNHSHHDHSHSHDHSHTNVTLTEVQAADPHVSAVSIIADCDAVLARGMGRGMYHNLQQAGIRPLLTKIAPINTAVTAYIEGRLTEHPELVH
jgi:predicted Fe-Mo cluster-binding NifX family protein